MALFQKYTAHFPDHDHEVEVAHDGESFIVRDLGIVGASTETASPASSLVSWDELECGRVLLRIDGRPIECRITRLPDGTMRIEWRGRHLPIRVADDLSERARLAHAHHGGPLPLRSPMPGTVVKVLVQDGETVLLEQPLLIVEAMKMQNELAAPMAGKIVNLAARPGQAVEADQVLLEIRP